MNVYWAYVLSPTAHGGIAINRVDLRCADEEDAKAQAKALAVRDTVELWDGASLIARYEPNVK